jgi:hypothetical protein
LCLSLPLSLSSLPSPSSSPFDRPVPRYLEIAIHGSQQIPHASGFGIIFENLEKKLDQGETREGTKKRKKGREKEGREKRRREGRNK